MHLVLHIFRKDIRNLRWHVLLSCLLAIAAIWPSTWTLWARHLNGLLPMLLALQWSLLIALLIHQEPLAGERSYWLARPIPRKHLLAAKLLFVLTAIHLPVLLIDFATLVRLGFPILPHITGLVTKQLLLFTTLVLPLLTIAAITRNLAQFLTVVAAAIVSIVLMFNVPRITFAGPFLWVPVTLVRGIVLLVAGAGLVWLYQSRRILPARVAGAALFTALLVILLFLPFHLIFAVQEQVSLRTEPPLTMRFDPSIRPARVPDLRAWAPFLRVRTDLALQLSADTKGLRCLRQQAIITLADGSKLTPESSDFYIGFTNNRVDRPTLSLTFVDDDRYRSLRNQPVDINVHFYMARLSPSAEGTFAVPDGKALIPGLGLCTAKVNRDVRALLAYCSRPFRDPVGFEMTLYTATGRELAGRALPNPAQYDPMPAGNSIFPFGVAVLNQWSLDPQHYNALSPADLNGARAHVTAVEAVSHFQSDLNIKGITLGDYEVRQR